MDMRSVSRQIRLSRWAEIIRQRVESGKPIRLWCEENGIKEKAYHYWKHQLQESAYEQIKTSLPAKYQSGLPVQGFAEIKMDQQADQIPYPYEGQTSHICIELGEVRITAGNTYSPESMAIILRELLRPC